MASRMHAPTVAQVLADQKPDQTIDRDGNVHRAVVPTVQNNWSAPVLDPTHYEENLRRDTAGIGSIVTFNGKDGGYVLDKQPFDINRHFLARPDLISWGYILFTDDAPVTHMCGIGDGPPIDRSELPDPPIDGAPNPNWKRNAFGEITDPWQFQEILPIAALDAGGAVYRLVGRNWATRKAMAHFRKNVVDNLYHRRGLAPVIQLIDTTEFNKKRQIEVPKPIIHIIGWRNPDGSEATEVPTAATTKRNPQLTTSGKSLLGDEMNDSLDF